MESLPSPESGKFEELKNLFKEKRMAATDKLQFYTEVSNFMGNLRIKIGPENLDKIRFSHILSGSSIYPETPILSDDLPDNRIENFIRSLP